MIGVLAGVPLVAVGITATKLGGPVVLECVAALVMAASGIAVANMHLRLALRPGHALSRTLFVIAAVSLVFGMLLAAMYGVRFLLKSEDLENGWNPSTTSEGSPRDARRCATAIRSPARIIVAAQGVFRRRRPRRRRPSRSASNRPRATRSHPCLRMAGRSRPSGRPTDDLTPPMISSSRRAI